MGASISGTSRSCVGKDDDDDDDDDDDGLNDDVFVMDGPPNQHLLSRRSLHEHHPACGQPRHAKKALLKRDPQHLSPLDLTLERRRHLPFRPLIDWQPNEGHREPSFQAPESWANLFGLDSADHSPNDPHPLGGGNSSGVIYEEDSDYETVLSPMTSNGASADGRDAHRGGGSGSGGVAGRSCNVNVSPGGRLIPFPPTLELPSAGELVFVLNEGNCRAAKPGNRIYESNTGK